MCGIYVSISRVGYRPATTLIRKRLQRRGPDSFLEHYFEVPLTNAAAVGARLYISVASSVLALRGTDLVPQPIFHDSVKSFFCWNGEAYSDLGGEVTGNDAQHVFSLLQRGMQKQRAEAAHAALLTALESIRGPFAMVFYDSAHDKLYFGRDFLGRRSLELSNSLNHDLLISSVSDASSGEVWQEVATPAIFCIDLQKQAEYQGAIHVMSDNLNPIGSVSARGQITSLFPAINTASPPQEQERLSEDSAVVCSLASLLLTSLRLRICNVRPRTHTALQLSLEANVAVLFSGGVDCTVLARLSHELLPQDEPIDLLNVAFENPRIHTDSAVNPYELCPDRITARRSHGELLHTCPGRNFRLITIDVPYANTLAHRPTITELIHPHNTEMDLSIATALYFASRGIGTVSCSDTGHRWVHNLNPKPNDHSYSTPARVLLSGLGADELFGGYQRHAIAYDRRGHSGLVEELELDFTRLSKRNLGRDDRVISHWGKEARYPYLDEGFVSWALGIPAWQKCGFGTRRAEGDYGRRQELEDGKLALRLLADKLGLHGVAREKKTAIQFGTRTAKMESGRVKGTTKLEVNGS